MAPIPGGLPENAYWFSCLGEPSSNDQRVGDHFLKRGCVPKLFERDHFDLPFSICLFGRNFTQEDALLHHQTDLFMVCQKKFSSVFEFGAKIDISSFGTKNNEAKIEKSACFRKEIREFMHFISLYLSSPWNDDTKWMCENCIPDLTKNVTVLWQHFKSLSDLPAAVLYSSSFHGNRSTHPSFHLVHLQLEVQWYRLSVHFRLVQLMELGEQGSELCTASEDLKLFVESLLASLFAVAVKRFEKISSSELKKKSPFSCSCFKELWLLVQIFVDRYHHVRHQNDFWMHMNVLYTRLLAPVENKTAAFHCSNPIVFSVWFLFHLALLYCYTENGDYEGPGCSRMVSNYPLLERVVKQLVSPEGATEAQLRACLPFITTLVTDLWAPQRSPVLTLWEHFHQRLNSCFFLQGATPDSLAVPCASGADLLQQVMSTMDPPKSKPENSFQLFMRLLSLFLRKAPTQWSNLKGRIFLKFSPMRMQALKEMGIYNTSCLFLALAWTGNTQEVGNKLQELLGHVTSPSLDVSRRKMVWKAHLALHQLYVCKGLDVSEISKPLLDDVTLMSSMKESDSLFGTLIRGLQDIVNASETLDFSEYTLLGSWIPCYLGAAPDEVHLFEVLNSIMSKILFISSRMGLVEYNASESQLTKMYQALCEHFLPYIKGKFANPDTCTNINWVAKLAVNITLLALNRANVGVNTMPFTHFFESFAVNANPVNANLSVKYVVSLLQNEDTHAELMDTYSNYHVLLIQTWLRCSVYVLDDNSVELQQLTNVVCRLPPLMSLCGEVQIDLKAQPMPLVAFLQMLGLLFTSKSDLDEKTRFRDQCTQYLMPMVKSFERMLRFKDVSERVVQRIYQVAACLVVHCGGIIYTKTNPFCIFNRLMSQLVLPVQIYKPGATLHPFLVSALSKTLPKFIRGTVLLNEVNSNALMPTLRDLVERYFPTLVSRSAQKPTEGSHPMLQCFSESEDKNVSKLVLEIITSKFLKEESRAPNRSASLALMFLMELLHLKHFGDDIVELVIDVSLLSILEVMIFTDFKMPVVKRQATNLLKEILNNKVNSHVCLRDKFWLTVLNFCRKYLLTSVTSVMGLLSKLCEWSPAMMVAGLPQVQQLMNSSMLTQRSDIIRTMRISLESMEKALETVQQR